MRLNNFLNEAFQDKVYFHGNVLWVAYGAGSGNTEMLNKKTYLTDKQGDKNFSSIVRLLVKFSSTEKPLKQKGNSKLFKISVYNKNDIDTKFDIYGGEIKPWKYSYMIVNTGSINVINFFDSKNEALAWINTTI